MKVAIVVTNSDLAGAPIHCSYLIRSLVKAGNSVYFFSGEAREIFNQLQELGVPCEVVDGLCSRVSLWKDLKAVLKLRHRLKVLDVDVIHLHSSKAGLVGRFAAFSLGLPVIYTVHGWGFGPARPKLQSFLVRLCELATKPLTAHWIAVSESDRQQGIECLSLSPAKITTIYNGIPRVDLADKTCMRTEKGAAFRLVMVARNSYQKDYDTLFRALAIIPMTVNLELLVIGEGTDEPAFKERAFTLAAQRRKNIVFMGLRHDVASILATCDVFCLTSRYEGLPIAIIEALMAGLPVIASDVGGVRELVFEGENGYLVSRGQERDVAAKIYKLAENPELVWRFGNRSRNLYHTRFTVEAMGQEVLKLYSKLAPGK